MPIINILITIVIVGVLLWLVNALLPIDAKIKQILNAVVIILLVLWLVSLFVPGLPTIRVGPH